MELCERLPSWLRWVLLPLTPLVSFFICHALGVAFFKLLNFIWTDGRGTERFMTVFAVPVWAGYVSAGVTGAMAPKGQNAVVFGLVFLVSVVAGFGFAFLAAIGQWRTLLETIPCVAGYFFAGYAICTEPPTALEAAALLFADETERSGLPAGQPRDGASHE